MDTGCWAEFGSAWTFWYAFAAARFNTEFMAYTLAVRTAVRFEIGLEGRYSVRAFNSLREAWADEGTTRAEELLRLLPSELDDGGFYVLQLRQEI